MSNPGTTRYLNKSLLERLVEKFPWLGTDEPVDGSDVVEDLTDLYYDLGGKERDEASDELHDFEDDDEDDDDDDEDDEDGD